MQNNNNQNNKPLNTKRFFTLSDIDKALSKKGFHKRKIKNENFAKSKCCSDLISEKLFIRFGYAIVCCSNCGKIIKVYRKIPSLKQKLDFYELNAILSEIDQAFYNGEI